MTGSARSFSALRTATIAATMALTVSSLVQQPLNAQKTRRNRLIETLEAGKPALTGDSWIFVDREHRPYDVTELRQTLNTMFANKNAQGQPALAPIVRVPTEGDQDVRWVIKQVLESGAMGIIVPQVDDAAQTLKIVQSMRYPQLKDSKYPNPPGRRGCGCSGGGAWGLQNPGGLRPGGRPMASQP